MGRPRSLPEIRPRKRRRSAPLRILFVTADASPWVKTGGPGDVTASLPAALTSLGHDVVTVMPRYRGVDVATSEVTTLRLRSGSLDETATLLETRARDGHRVVMVDVPALYGRLGHYGEAGQDYADNAQRFAVLSLAALEYAMTRIERWPVDVVHAHDWQAGLVPAWIRADPARFGALGRAGLVMTIHNLAYQGLFSGDVLPALGLPWAAFTPDRGEFWGKFGFLKAGISYSDLITTVSPRYARETLTSECGAGLEGVLALRMNRYRGILNGIDTSSWDPMNDPSLPARFNAGALAGKRTCKRELLSRLGLACGDDALERPLVAMVCRLVDQKGIDLVLEVAQKLLALDATWVVVGEGESRYETAFRDLALAYPTRFGVHVGFDEPLARLATAGADIFLMPSRFEPCGLGQMYALRYGAVPVVTPVGGLDDTIQPYTKRAKHANGLKLRRVTAADLLRTMKHAVRLYQDRNVWLRLIQEGMSSDLSWQTAAGEYVKVYRQALEIAALRGGL